MWHWIKLHSEGAGLSWLVDNGLVHIKGIWTTGGAQIYFRVCKDVGLAFWSETEFINASKSGISEYRDVGGKRVPPCLGLS